MGSGDGFDDTLLAKISRGPGDHWATTIGAARVREGTVKLIVKS